MPATLICPVAHCLHTFARSMDLKTHLNIHLACHWFDCPFCLKRYLQHADAAAHVVACPSRESDMACDVREGWDARHPLLVVWSLGMGLPFLKEGGSGDAQMLVRNNPEQVWECAKNSREIKFRR